MYEFIKCLRNVGLSHLNLSSKSIPNHQNKRALVQHVTQTNRELIEFLLLCCCVYRVFIISREQEKLRKMKEKKKKKQFYYYSENKYICGASSVQRTECRIRIWYWNNYLKHWGDEWAWGRNLNINIDDKELWKQKKKQNNKILKTTQRFFSFVFPYFSIRNDRWSVVRLKKKTNILNSIEKYIPFGTSVWNSFYWLMVHIGQTRDT